MVIMNIEVFLYEWFTTHFDHLPAQKNRLHFFGFQIKNYVACLYITADPDKQFVQSFCFFYDGTF